MGNSQSCMINPLGYINAKRSQSTMGLSTHAHAASAASHAAADGYPSSYARKKRLKKCGSVMIPFAENEPVSIAGKSRHPTMSTFCLSQPSLNDSFRSSGNSLSQSIDHGKRHHHQHQQRVDYTAGHFDAAQQLHQQRQRTSNLLQHISDREPNDWCEDPSLHPTTQTMFLMKSDLSPKDDAYFKARQLPTRSSTSCYAFLDATRTNRYQVDQPTNGHPCVFHERALSRDKDLYDTNALTDVVREPKLVKARCWRSRDVKAEPPISRIRAWASCSTILIDESTVSQPELRLTLKCVSLAIYYHIRNDQVERHVESVEPARMLPCRAPSQQPHPRRILDIFDEYLHPLTDEPVPVTYDQQVPEHRHIYRFMRALFGAAQLTSECAVIALIYLERLMKFGDLTICAGSWKRMVLGVILLASKVWDDQAVWNVDYCQILKDLTVEDMNELERRCLEMLQFNINVPSSVYAKYYFDLRVLAHRCGFVATKRLLSIERAAQLDIPVASGLHSRCLHDFSNTSSSGSNGGANQVSTPSTTNQQNCRPVVRSRSATDFATSTRAAVIM